MANRDLFDLTGRNALVTGGGRGLGKSMAIGLAQYGANIAIVDIDLGNGTEYSRRDPGAGRAVDCLAR